MSASPEPAAAAPLPDDVATLKVLLLAERATSAKLAGHNEQLRAIVKELQRALFGRRSEKAAHPDQLQLASRTSSRRWPRARPRQRRPTRRYKRRAGSGAVSIAGRCPSTCRGKRS